MPMIVDRLAYPRAILRDLDNREVSKGVAHVDSEKRHARFFPSQREDAETVKAKAAILEMEGGLTFRIQRIRHSETPQWGYAGPHYEIELEPAP
jgi:hypothetical protein